MSSPILVMVCDTSSGDRPTEGSSTSSRRGDDISARAIASICCWPPDMVPASWPCSSFSAGKVSKASARLRSMSAGPPCGRRRASGFPARSAWETAVALPAPCATPRSTMASGDSLVRSCAVPSIVSVTLPRCGRTRPGDALHQGALAVAVGAEQRDGLAGLDVETDAAQRLDGAVTGIDVGDGEAKCQGKPPAPAGWPSPRPACRSR